EVLEILQPSADRIDAPCPLFTRCGGCNWQHLPIEVQREWKERIVRDSLRPLPDSAALDVRPLVTSPDTWRYRNKMEYTFARVNSGRLACGFHTPGNWWRILDVEQCVRAPEGMDRIL